MVTHTRQELGLRFPDGRGSTSVTVLLCRIVLFIAFVGVGLQKAIGASDPPAALVQAIPGWVWHVPEIRATWRMIGAVEALIGVGLVFSRSRWWPVGASGGFLAVFAFWLAWQAFAGRTTCDCGTGVEFLERIEVAIIRHAVLGVCWGAIVSRGPSTSGWVRGAASGAPNGAESGSRQQS